MKVYAGLLAAALVVVLGSVASATPLLSVDFGQSQTPGYVQPGFEAWHNTNFPPVGNGPVTKTIGSYTVGIASSNDLGNTQLVNASGDLATTDSDTVVGRDRLNTSFPSGTWNNGAFSYGDLYRDFITCRKYMAVQIGGLDPTTEYSITFYAYDHNNTYTQTFTDITGATASNLNGANVALGSIAWTKTTDFTGASNDIYALTATATSDASGRLTFRLNCPASNVATDLNGLTLNIVPEPASLSLLCLSGLMIAARRRRTS